MGETDFPNIHYGDLGYCAIDPSLKEFAHIQSQCERGNGWRCLLASMVTAIWGDQVKKPYVDLDLATHRGSLAITYGEYRYTRPLTGIEMSAAVQFEMGRDVGGPIRMILDLNDGTWERCPKRGSENGKPAGPRSKKRGGNAKPETKTRRAATFKAVQRTLATEGSYQRNHP